MVKACLRVYVCTIHGCNIPILSINVRTYVHMYPHTLGPNSWYMCVSLGGTCEQQSVDPHSSELGTCTYIYVRTYVHT